MRNFKKNLKQLRLEMNFTQMDLGNLLSVSDKTISHWETGYTKPNYIFLIKLAQIFEMTVDQLIND